MFASMAFGFQEAAKQKGGGSAAELDEVKRMLIETNPWFLALTGVVSVLHVVSVIHAYTLCLLTRTQVRDVGVQVRCLSLAKEG